MRIRPVAVGDLAACYDICLRTGDSGADATSLYTDPCLVGHVYAGPYVALPEGLGFVATDRAGVAGYVLGTADTRTFEAACEQRWWPELRARLPRPSGDAGTPDERLVGLVHRPPVAAAEVVGPYPAHLHIDLLPRRQGTGAGRALIEAFLDAVRPAGGVHLGVGRTNENAIGFYRHLGFTTLAESPDALTLGLRL